MPRPAEKAATYADLARVPAHLVAELVGGDLVTHPRPALRHAVASNALGHELTGPFQRGTGGGPGGWIFMDEPELHLEQDVLVPDLAGWREGRFPDLADGNWTDLPPDWLCEVTSPSTRAYDRAVKLRLYGRAGVPNVWLLDPGARLLEVLILAGSEYLNASAYRDHEVVSAPPFEAASFPLNVLWPYDRQGEGK